MDSSFTVRNDMVTQLSRNWGLLMSKGIIGLVFGIWALFMTGQTVATLAALVGIYLLLDGGCSWIIASSSATAATSLGNLMADGVLTIIAGIITFFLTTSPTALVWTWVVWGVVTGIVQIAGGQRLRRLADIGGVTEGGGLAILLAIALAIASTQLLGVWAICLGIYGIVYGLDFIGLGGQMHKALTLSASQPGRRATVQPPVQEPRETPTHSNR